MVIAVEALGADGKPHRFCVGAKVKARDQDCWLEGTIVELRLKSGGALVDVPGEGLPGGFGWEEMVVLSEGEQATAFVALESAAAWVCNQAAGFKLPSCVDEAIVSLRRAVEAVESKAPSA